MAPRSDSETHDETFEMSMETDEAVLVEERPDPQSESTAAAMGTKLRVGVLVDDFEQAAWVAQVLQEIQSSDFAEIVLVVRNAVDPYAPTPGEAPATGPLARVSRWWRYRHVLPFNLFRRLDTRWSASPGDPERRVDVSTLLGEIPSVTVMPRMTKFCDYFEEPALGEIRRYDLDVALRFGFRIMKGEGLRIARHGVWSFHHGDNSVLRGGPASFWEVAQGDPTSGAMLQVLSEELDDGLVLARSLSRTHRYSPGANKRDYYWQAAGLAMAKLRALHARGAGLLDEARADARDWSAYSRRLFVNPTSGEVVRTAVRLGARAVRTWVGSIGVREEWFLAYRLAKPVPGREGVPEGSPYRLKELVPPPDRSWTRPAAAVHEGVHYMFFEERLRGETRAHVCVCEVTGGAGGVAGAPRRVLERPHGVSAPFVFSWNGAWYMLVVASGQHAVELHRATAFPDAWTFERTVLAGVDAQEAVLAHIGSRWWLFVGVRAPNALEATVLHAYHAATPLGPWAPHEANPLEVNVDGARPAGPPFRYNDVWYRPGQVGVPTEGSAVVVHRIDELTPRTFREVEVARMTPEWQPRLTGVRTLAAAGSLTVADVRRRARRFR